MTDNQYGPDKPCRRPACIEAERATLRAEGNPYAEACDIPSHLGGAHLNPADRAHYDGLRIQAMPEPVRRAAAPLLSSVGGFAGPPAATPDSPIRAAAEAALDSAFREIDRLSQQIAHVRVDADHRILDASRRAQDCNRHGQAIRDAEVQLAVADQRYDRAEKARLALLGEHQALGELVDRWAALNPTDRPDADTLIEALRKTHTKTSAARARAWNTRTPTRKDTAT